jgi:hypothetical protein
MAMNATTATTIMKIYRPSMPDTPHQASEPTLARAGRIHDKNEGAAPVHPRRGHEEAFFCEELNVSTRTFAELLLDRL